MGILSQFLKRKKTCVTSGLVSCTLVLFEKDGLFKERVVAKGSKFFLL